MYIIANINPYLGNVDLSNSQKLIPSLKQISDFIRFYIIFKHSKKKYIYEERCVKYFI